MRTWKEYILDAMTGRNKKGIPLWYDNATIMSEVSKLAGYDIRVKYKSLTCFLYDLTKTGHIERAVKPRELSKKVCYDPSKEFLYRVTGKPYVHRFGNLNTYKNQGSNIEAVSTQAHNIWREHKTLPKWYRRMMLD